MEKAKQREREHEVIYERKIAKERSKDDHLFADKDKFVTAAYKRKLQEQAKWLEEEHLRELREERDDVSEIFSFLFCSLLAYLYTQGIYVKIMDSHNLVLHHNHLMTEHVLARS